MTTLRFPGDVTVSGDALMLIADALGVSVADIRVSTDATPAALSVVDVAAGGWLYQRPGDEDDDVPVGEVRLLAGVTGWSVGSRWSGVTR